MKCPRCGVWNQAALPRCFQCGTPLEKKKTQQDTPDWRQDLENVEPDGMYITYAGDSDDATLTMERERIREAESLGTEIEHLKERRKRGTEQLQRLRASARAAQEAMANASIIKPLAEGEEPEANAPRPRQQPEKIGRRRQRKQQEYLHAVKGPGRGDTTARVMWEPPVDGAAHGVTESLVSPRPWEQQVFMYVEEEDAPVLYDGYMEPPVDQVRDTVMQSTDPMFYEHQKATWAASQYDSVSNTAYRRQATSGVTRSRVKKGMPFPLRMVLWGLLLVVVAVGTTVGVLWAIDTLGMRDTTNTAAAIQTKATVEKVTEAGVPSHRILIEGTEGTHIYVRELEKSYVVTGGVAQILISDYFWFENRSDITTSTLDVSLTPFVKYPSGEQKAMTTLTYTIDVPVSTALLMRPDSLYTTVSTSIFEIRLQVDKGSSVVIDGDNVTSMIDSNGRVSKNVQVQPIGENRIQVSVRNDYAREHTFEIVLYRPPQDIPLEMIPTTLSESDTNQMVLNGTTMPGATIILESPFVEDSLDVTQLDTTGAFSFAAFFPKIGDNEVVVRAQYPDKEDSVMTHVVYYMPNVDEYTRKAWALNPSDYTDLINNISIRKGQIYFCMGTIKQVISERPQMALMDIGTESDGIERLVLIENSTKTTWEEGEWYRVYADAFGLYDTMPRLTARYTYKKDEK